jgi:hypothetical protein
MGVSSDVLLLFFERHSGAMRSIDPSGAPLRTEILAIPGLVVRTIPE